MGCDIHLYAEAKRNGVWEIVPSIEYNDRNYRAFSILAGVRRCNNLQSISARRGLPKDLSEQVAKLVPKCDDFYYFGHSYHTLGQLEAFDWSCSAVERGVETTYAEQAGRLWSYVIPRLRELVDGGAEDARIVFWFDN